MPYNSTLAIGGVSTPLYRFEVAEISVLRTNFCAKNPAYQRSANRYRALFKTTPNSLINEKANSNYCN